MSSLGNTIVVTFNYRLGVLGFLKSNRKEGGNFGLYDQRMALQWVVNNIKEFGGDSSKITLFGAGAGAASINIQWLSDVYDRSMFQRIILQSGSAISPWIDVWKNRNINFKWQGQNQASCSLINLGKQFGCLPKNFSSNYIGTYDSNYGASSTARPPYTLTPSRRRSNAPKILDCLREKASWKQIYANLQKMMPKHRRCEKNMWSRFKFQPTLDGWTMTNSSSAKLANGEMDSLDVMQGINTADGMRFTNKFSVRNGIITADKFSKALQQLINDYFPTGSERQNQTRLKIANNFYDTWGNKATNNFRSKKQATLDSVKNLSKLTSLRNSPKTRQDLINLFTDHQFLAPMQKLASTISTYQPKQANFVYIWNQTIWKNSQPFIAEEDFFIFGHPFQFEKQEFKSQNYNVRHPETGAYNIYKGVLQSGDKSKDSPLEIQNKRVAFQRLSFQIIQCYSNFARTGDPSKGGDYTLSTKVNRNAQNTNWQGGRWLSYNKNKTVAVFNSRGTVVRTGGYRENFNKFWNQFFPDLLNSKNSPDFTNTVKSKNGNTKLSNFNKKNVNVEFNSGYLNTNTGNLNKNSGKSSPQTTGNPQTSKKPKKPVLMANGYPMGMDNLPDYINTSWTEPTPEETSSHRRQGDSIGSQDDLSADVLITMSIGISLLVFNFAAFTRWYWKRKQQRKQYLKELAEQEKTLKSLMDQEEQQQKRIDSRPSLLITPPPPPPQVGKSKSGVFSGVSGFKFGSSLNFGSGAGFVDESVGYGSAPKIGGISEDLQTASAGYSARSQTLPKLKAHNSSETDTTNFPPLPNSIVGTSDTG